MKQTYSADVLEFLGGVNGIVEATRFEQSALWKEYKEFRPQSTWKEINGGYLLTVGFLKDKPTTISVDYAIIEGKKILFWYSPSMVTDYRKIEKFFKKYLAGVPKTDATNFYNVL